MKRSLSDQQLKFFYGELGNIQKDLDKFYTKLHQNDQNLKGVIKRLKLLRFRFDECYKRLKNRRQTSDEDKNRIVEIQSKLDSCSQTIALKDSQLDEILRRMREMSDTCLVFQNFSRLPGAREYFAEEPYHANNPGNRALTYQQLIDDPKYTRTQRFFSEEYEHLNFYHESEIGRFSYGKWLREATA